MRNAIRLTAVITGAVVLSGCKLLGLQHASAASEQPAMASAAADQAADQDANRLQSGRQNLAADRFGLAIEDFNMALARGEDPAAAYNGLGVAYSRLGRDDLAFRFFSKARMSAPDNPTYARNLAMLMSSPGFNLQEMSRPFYPAEQVAAQTPPPDRPTLTQASSRATERGAAVHLVRQGNREFSLVTTEPNGAEPPASRRAEANCATDRRAAACASPHLPTVSSRSKAARRNAGIAPAPLAAAAEAGAASAPIPAAPGKRKTVSISQVSAQTAPAFEPSVQTVASRNK
jgi:tetratricopeptide (TPR) repeat protein